MTMPPTEEQVKRKARILAAFMSSLDATKFANSFALDPDHFINEWAERKDARERLAKGYQPPRIDDLPDAAAAHLEAVQAHPQFSAIYGSSAPTFKSIELGRLIARQVWVDADFVDGLHGAGNAGQPTDDDLLKMCLPLEVVPNARARWKREKDETSGRVTFSVYSHNNTFNFEDGFDDKTGEINFTIGARANLMCVYDVNGRFFLSNGYHRAWWLLSRKITMAPVMIFAALTPPPVRPGAVGPLVMMDDDQPPLLKHFLDDQISLTEVIRATLRVVRITAEAEAVHWL